MIHICLNENPLSHLVGLESDIQFSSSPVHKKQFMSLVPYLDLSKYMRIIVFKNIQEQGKETKRDEINRQLDEVFKIFQCVCTKIITLEDQCTVLVYFSHLFPY